MACSRVLGPFTFQLFSHGNVVYYVPCTAWIPAIGVDEVRFALKNLATITNSTGNDFTTRLAIQVAGADTTEPDVTSDIQGVEDWAPLGTSRSGDGEWLETVDISATTEDEFFVRFGIAYQNESTGAGVLTQGVTNVLLDLPSCGRVVGTGTVVLRSTLNDVQYEAFTPWIPARCVQEVKFAILQKEQGGAGAGGSPYLETAVAIQTATTDQASPNAWELIESTPVWRSGEKKQCTGELDVSSETSGAFWVRFGLGYRVPDGKDWGALEVTVSVSVRE